MGTSPVRAAGRSGGAGRAVELLRRAVEEGSTPGGVVLAGRGPGTELSEAVGWAQVGEHPRPMTTGTLFDLASLTKVAATLPVALRLVAEGRLELGTRVAEVLPEFGASPAPRATVTVEHLLTHTSGLPSERRYWQLGLPAPELRRRFLSEPLVSPPGTQVAYSDLGFLVLGWLVEAVAGAPLDDLVARHVAGPLGLGQLRFGPVPAAEAAATEPGPDGRYVVGTVHDENAAALGRAAGHAGLFSTGPDLARYLQAWTAAGDAWLPHRLRADAARDRTAGLGGHRGLGWVARGDAQDHLGSGWPPTAVSHTGFTGTSLGFDMPSGRWVVLLTNDVHFGRGRGLVNALREAVQGALAP